MQPARAKVLVVDDVPANIEIIYEAFKDDYELLFATSGEDALVLAQRELPDLVLLDVMMPGLDGYETCRRLKANPLTRGIPVIFASALNEDVDELAGLNLGAVDYLTKPIRVPIARARIRNHIEHKQVITLLEQQARRDALTGLANRRLFEEVLEREWRRCARSSTPLALLLIDVDLFKRYNDHYGHGMGDVCLKAVGATLGQSARRPGDLIARYGGEEFIGVFPETSLEAAIVVAQHMRDDIAARRIAHNESPHGVVTISVGVACCTPVAAPTDRNGELQALIDEADRQLYAAKQAGRNTVVPAPLPQ